MRLHGWAVVCDEAGVKVEYLNCDNGTRVVFHRNDPFAESTSSEEFASGSQAAQRMTEVGRSWPKPTRAAYPSACFEGTTTSEVAAELETSERTARRLIAQLIDDRLFVAESSTNNRIYCIPSKH